MNRYYVYGTHAVEEEERYTTHVYSVLKKFHPEDLEAAELMKEFLFDSSYLSNLKDLPEEILRIFLESGLLVSDNTNLSIDFDKVHTYRRLLEAEEKHAYSNYPAEAEFICCFSDRIEPVDESTLRDFIIC